MKKDLVKEIAKLKRENKKLKAALNEEGIEPYTEVLGRKNTVILTGKELKIAAIKGLKVRYVEKYNNPQDKHKNFNADCVMEKCPSNDFEGEYYIGHGSLNINDFKDDEYMSMGFDEGFFEVRKAKGVKYD